MASVDAHVGIVIPAYREAQSIGALLTDLRRLLPAAPIVVVDDSPDDTTMSAIRRACVTDVDALHRSSKGGRGSAVRVGMTRVLARSVDIVVEMDADYSHAPRELLSHLREA